MKLKLLKKQIWIWPLCAAFCIALFIGLSACTSKNDVKVLEDRLTEMPNYSLPENATQNDMRRTAVRAMHDELSVQWYPEKYFEYTKTGVASDRIFQFKPEKNYAGLPYSNGESSLFHWLQYYDFETGQLDDAIFPKVNLNLGNTCACSVMWGWLTVCPDIQWDATRNIFPKNGGIPVAGYDYPEDIDDYEITSTDDICMANGRAKMFDAYANSRMADLFMVFGSDNHVIMAIEDPVIRRRGDGSINGNTSYVLCQDQRFGTVHASYQKRINDTTVHFSGRTAFVITFEQLYTYGMIPMTTAQFLGQKPYEKPKATLEGDTPETYMDFAKMHIQSNYDIITATIRISDENNKKEVAEKKYVRVCNYRFKTQDKSRDKQRNLSYYLSNQTDGIALNPTLITAMEKGKTYTVTLETLVANGETLKVFEGKLKY